jgi:hypothetical protein
MKKNTETTKLGLAEMLKGGVITPHYLRAV